MTETKSRWITWCWRLAVGGLLIAGLPLAIALVGLALSNQALQAYHWYLYFSIPTGLVVTIPSCIAAIILMIMRKIQTE